MITIHVTAGSYDGLGSLKACSADFYFAAGALNIPQFLQGPPRLGLKRLEVSFRRSEDQLSVFLTIRSSPYALIWIIL